MKHKNLKQFISMTGVFFRHLKFKLLSKKLRDIQATVKILDEMYYSSRAPTSREGTPGPYYVKPHDNPMSERAYTDTRGNAWRNAWRNALCASAVKGRERQFVEGNRREHIAWLTKVCILNGYSWNVIYSIMR